VTWIVAEHDGQKFFSGKIFGAVAQLGERRFCTPEVAGSIPVSSTIFLSHQNKIKRNSPPKVWGWNRSSRSLTIE
jgi:hypothetical protein